MSFTDSKIVTISKDDPVSKYGKTFQIANIYLTDSFYDREESIVPEHYCLLYTSPSPRDATLSRMPSSA